MRVRADFSSQRRKTTSDSALHDLHELVLRLQSYGSDIAVIEKTGEQKIFHTAEKLSCDVEALATQLHSRGLCNCNIALLGENSYRWIVCFLAIACGVGTAVLLDKELTDAELDAQLLKSDSAALFCTSTFYETAVRNKKENPHLQDVFLIDDKDCEFPDFSQLLTSGKKLLSKGDRSFAQLQCLSQTPAALIFTSGTTGPNKGVLLTQKNLVSNINTIAQNVSAKESTISVLPMNHIYELNCNILPMLYMQTVICINDRMRNLMHNLRFFQPQMAVVVPLFLESFYNHICQKLRKDGLDVKYERKIALSNSLLEKGIDIRRTLFRRVHEYFGNELSLLICGGAPVDAKYVKGLTELGFDIFVGYGLTEASPIAALNKETRTHPDSVGKPFPNVSLHIHAPDPDGEGEVWLRGDNITPGYYNDITATNESFEDGWFKTGDYGKMLSDGYLQLTGRKKDLIILNNGKNVHPEELESVIRAQLPYVLEVVVMETEKMIFGVCQKIIAAVLYVDTDLFDGMTAEQIRQKAKCDMQNVNAKLPGYKTVSHVLIAEESFQKTSTNKILRRKVKERYCDCSQGDQSPQEGRA